MQTISLKEMQQIELNLLLEFDKLCKAHHLRYYLDGGTLLGAMCYEGFIPWDDDIDLKMPRPDYERLLQLADQLPAHIALEVPTANCCPHLFLKLTDTRTVLLEHSGDRVNESGVYIDILPMDGHPADTKTAAAHLRRLSRCNSLFHAAQNCFAEMCAAPSLATRLKGRIYRKLYTPWKLYQKLTETAKRYKYDCCSQVGLVIEGDPIRERFEKSWLEPPIQLEFEGHSFPAPSEYRRHMEIFYGEHVTKPECYHNLPQYPGNHSYEVFWKEDSEHGNQGPQS